MRGVARVARDLLLLTKPRLSSLVLCTAAGGLWLAPSRLSPAKAFLSLLFIAGCVGAANALNCYLERTTDGKMDRTRNRPLPAGRLRPRVALAFGTFVALLSIAGLWLFVNPVTGLLGALAVALYVGVYTPLKTRSSGAVWVGAVAGALPPLLGWTAASGRVGEGGWVLFVLLYAWQLPHLLAISFFRAEDYSRASIRSLPAVLGDRRARLLAVAGVLALGVVSIAPFAMGMAGRLYLAVALTLGVVFTALAGSGFVAVDATRWARRLFVFSLLHLSGVFGALILDAQRFEP